MDEVLAADGADLAHGEEAGDGDRAEDLVDQAHVVVGLVEEPGAAAVASEEQGTRRAGRWPDCRAQRAGFAQVLVGGLGVADVELDGLADADQVGDRDGPGVVGPDHVADQEVAALERLLVLVDHPADVQAVLDPPLVVGGRAPGTCRGGPRARGGGPARG